MDLLDFLGGESSDSKKQEVKVEVKREIKAEVKSDVKREIKGEMLKSEKAGGGAAEKFEGKDGKKEGGGGEGATPLHQCEDKCNAIPFSLVVKILNEILAASGVHNKLDVIFNSKLKKLIGGQSIHPFARLLFPWQDTRKYGLKAAKIAGIYTDILQLNKDRGDGLALNKWQNEALAGAKHSGEFGSTLEMVLEHRVKNTSDKNKNKNTEEPPPKTIGDVNAILDKLSTVKGDKERKDIFDKEIKYHFNANEQKWIVRIIMQDLKIGLNHEPFLKRLAKFDYALNTFNTSLRLKETLDEVTNPKFEHPDDRARNAKRGRDAEGGGGGSGGGSSSNYYEGGIPNITCFLPMSPQLAKGFMRSGGNQIAEAERAMAKNSFDIEIKYDGERHMMHISGRKAMMFTRNGVDYTDKYFPLLGTVSKLCRESGVGTLILDGEVVAWSRDLDDHNKFGDNRSVAKLEHTKAIDSDWSRFDDDVDQAVYGPPPLYKLKDGDWRETEPKLGSWLKYVIFDIVLLDDTYGRPGTCEEIIETAAREIAREEGITCRLPLPKQGCIVNLPLAVRKRILQKILSDRGTGASREICNVVEIIKHTRVTMKDSKSRQDAIVDAFDKANFEGKEGLVIKDITSPYLIAARRENWVKLKPEYSDENNDFDCICLGLKYAEGTGWRQGMLCSMLVGVKDVDESGAFKGYVSFCSVGGGISKDQLVEMNDFLRGKTREIKNSNVDSKTTDIADFLQSMWKLLKPEDRPHVYVRPEDSFVVQIKGAELCYTEHFRSCITLRFPRLVKFRYDKRIDEITTLKEVQERKERPRTVTYEEMKQQHNRKRSKNIRTKVVGKQVDAYFRPVQVTDVAGSLFSGYCFSVLEGEGKLRNGLKKIDRVYLSGELLKQDATVLPQWDSPRDPDDKFFVVAFSQPYTYQVNFCIKHAELHKDSFDIISYEYICECLEENRILDLKPHHYIVKTRATEEMFLGKVDVFNLNYCEDMDVDSIRRFNDTFEDKLKALKRQIDTENEAANAEAKRLKQHSKGTTGSKKSNALTPRALVPSKEKPSELCLQRREAFEFYEGAKSKGYRNLASSFSPEERDFLFDCPSLAAFSVHAIIYVDIFADVGDILMPTSREQLSISRNASVVYAYKRPFGSPNDPLRALALLLESRGATLAPCLHTGVTHIIMSSDNLTRKDMIHQRLKELLSYPESNFNKRVCSPLWAQNILLEGKFRAPDNENFPGELIDPKVWF